MTRLLPFLFLLGSCGSLPTDASPYQDADLSLYLGMFYADWDFQTGVRHPASAIELRKVDSFDVDGVKKNAIGYCFPSVVKIEILKSFWRAASMVQKTMLMYHELGHCVLNREHTTATFKCKEQENGCPVSLMHPTLLYEKTFLKHESYYIREMFK